MFHIALNTYTICWYVPSENRTEDVGDIFEAAVAVFDDDDEDALAMRMLLELSEDHAKYMYDLLSSFAQKMHFFRHSSGLTISAALSLLFRRTPFIEFCGRGRASMLLVTLLFLRNMVKLDLQRSHSVVTQLLVMRM